MAALEAWKGHHAVDLRDLSEDNVTGNVPTPRDDLVAKAARIAGIG
jgi:hypothetical protein